MPSFLCTAETLWHNTGGKYNNLHPLSAELPDAIPNSNHQLVKGSCDLKEASLQGAMSTRDPDAFTAGGSWSESG